MLPWIRTIASVTACLAAKTPAQAALRVMATTPDWAALTTELGGERGNVDAAINAFQEVHHVEAKPSPVARARNCTGAVLGHGV